MGENSHRGRRAARCCFCDGRPPRDFQYDFAAAALSLPRLRHPALLRAIAMGERFTGRMVSAVTYAKGTYLPPPRLVCSSLI